MAIGSFCHPTLPSDFCSSGRCFSARVFLMSLCSSIEKDPFFLGLIRCRHESFLPVWRISSHEKGLSFSFHLIQSRTGHPVKGVSCGPSSLPLGHRKLQCSLLSLCKGGGPCRSHWWGVGSPTAAPCQDCALSREVALCLPCETPYGGTSMVSTSAPGGGQNPRIPPHMLPSGLDLRTVKEHPNNEGTQKWGKK